MNRDLYHAQVELFTKSRDLLKAVLPTALSALFWLEDPERRPSRQSPGRDTSSERVAHWGNADAKGRAKLRKKLYEEGYSLVYLVDYEPRAPQGGVGSPKSPHFRQAHWRDQWYGPRNARYQKRIRIEQTYVNPRGEQTEPPGHIYVPGLDTSQ